MCLFVDGDGDSVEIAGATHQPSVMVSRLGSSKKKGVPDASEIPEEDIVAGAKFAKDGIKVSKGITIPATNKFTFSLDNVSIPFGFSKYKGFTANITDEGHLKFFKGLREVTARHILNNLSALAPKLNQSFQVSFFVLFSPHPICVCIRVWILV